MISLVGAHQQDSVVREVEAKMSQSRTKLSNLRHTNPQDLVYCEGYMWHFESLIGKGTFGMVYLGWTNVWLEMYKIW